MKKIFLLLAILTIVLAACSSNQNLDQNSPHLNLTSSDFKDGKRIPTKYTCEGLDMSPPLEISNVPVNTKSLTIIMEDPDADGGSWIHWIVFNVPSNTKNITAGQQPEGNAGINSFNTLVYGGPCPPTKEHRYFFKLYALDKTLNLEEGASKEQVISEMKGHILAQTTLTGRYKKDD